jgi:hypothetical protein
VSIFVPVDSGVVFCSSKVSTSPWTFFSMVEISSAAGGLVTKRTNAIIKNVKIVIIIRMKPPVEVSYFRRGLTEWSKPYDGTMVSYL